ncbi:hypothetical protein D3C73_1350230 [compost metagenome]
MERENERNLAACYRVAGRLQGRRRLARHYRHSRRVAGDGTGASSLVFCDRRGEDDRQFCRSEKAGDGRQAVYPLCPGESSRYLRTGAHDGAVYHCSGNHFHDDGTFRVRKDGGYDFAEHHCKSD